MSKFVSVLITMFACYAGMVMTSSGIGLWNMYNLGVPLNSDTVGLVLGGSIFLSAIFALTTGFVIAIVRDIVEEVVGWIS